MIGQTPGPFSPSQLIDVVNYTLDYATPEVIVEGEVSGFNINQQKYIFFDIKDDKATVSCFMMLVALNVAIENGMQIRVIARPKLTIKGKFSLTISKIEPIGEGSIKRSFDLLKQKLTLEGLFDDSRKRPLVEFPNRLGLISSVKAAGANDFLTLVTQRWGGLEIIFTHIQVQGEGSPKQIIGAIKYFNEIDQPVDTLVLVRGGGSLEDLQSFNTESVARAIAGSRTPIVVGVGHEEDLTLADLAADVRAATPSHAAQIAVPNKQDMISRLASSREALTGKINYLLVGRTKHYEQALQFAISRVIRTITDKIAMLDQALVAYDPRQALKRGYSIVRFQNKILNSVKLVSAGDKLSLELSDGFVESKAENVEQKTS